MTTKKNAEEAPVANPKPTESTESTVRAWPGSDIFARFAQENIARAETWIEWAETFQSHAMDRVEANIEQATKLQRDQLAYASALGSSVRDASLETVRRTASIFGA